MNNSDGKRENTTMQIDNLIATVNLRLRELSEPQSLESLKTLFRSDLSYEFANKELSYRNWPDAMRNTVSEAPLLLATGGSQNNFAIIYIHLADQELLLGNERPIVTKLLQQHLDALFIFSNASQNKWHFINVKSDSVKSKRPLFRRITVGQEERLRTASQRIAMLDLTDRPQATALDIRQWHEEAFDVDAVTDAFFKHYKSLFDILQKDLTKQTRDDTWAHDYALQFLNRCMFLYFIQRKGWLGNDRDFLKTFWNSYCRLRDTQGDRPEYAPDAFFKHWLSILFFEAFNNRFLPTRHYFPSDIYAILMRAPYLNGGLFSPNRFDREKENEFNISDERFALVFNFLQSYNFTISEDSPLDQEVAVDPEMIGRVYENLVNVSSELEVRGDAGIFYTPRTEIDLMCRLSLVEYLANNLPDIPRSALNEIVFAFEDDEKARAAETLQKAHRDGWHKVDGLLRTLTMVDPACGSGAFLVGMLYVLDDLQERANAQLGKPREDPYTRKKRIIGQSLYGVDVMEWAAHIAELRLWLTLIIDTQMSAEDLHVRRDPLLPHLTFKVRYGDSLVQEVGGLNLGHMQTTSEISPVLKRRLTWLKDEKGKFYHHDPSCEFKTREAAMQEEVRLFRDILSERKQAVERRLRALDERATQSSLLDSSTPEDLERKRQIAEKEIEYNNLEKALRELVSPKQVPFVWDIAFVEVMYSGDTLGFDIVIGNPPYVRQELISPPLLPRQQVTEENKREYKQKLAAIVYQDYPDFFQFHPGTGHIGHKINAQSDLYIYFYLHGLRLLNPKGAFCFITSNSWLDVAYGADLQEFLLKYCQIRMIIDNQGKRSFKTAAVNTVIALFSAPTAKPTDAALRNIARFVLFTVDFEQILSADIFDAIEKATARTTTSTYRVYPIEQQTLLREGMETPKEESDATYTPARSGKTGRSHLLKEAPATYSSNKWGGKYLRAPDIYWTILEKGRGKLVRLGDIAEVRFGIKTGANEFFYLDEAKAKQWHIEPEFLQPAIKSPRECKSILIDPQTLNNKLFLCHKTKEELKGTAALEYIRWGEKQHYDKRPSCKSRPRWWDLGIRRSPYLSFNYLIDSTAKTFYAPRGCYFSDNFQEIAISSQSLVLSLCASLNSTVFQLMVNVAGRANFGDGLLKIQTYEVSDLLCLKPELIEMKTDEIFTSTSWNVLTPSFERHNLDTLIFDALDLTMEERDTVYKEVKKLVESRLNKANSLNAPNSRASEERRKRLEAVDNTLGIWMGMEWDTGIEEEVDSSHA